MQESCVNGCVERRVIICKEVVSMSGSCDEKYNTIQWHTVKSGKNTARKKRCN